MIPNEYGEFHLMRPCPAAGHLDTVLFAFCSHFGQPYVWLVSCIKLNQPFTYDTVSCAIVALFHLHIM